MDAARRAITAETALLSVVAVNNEIGVIQPVAALSALARDVGALVHVDAAQAYGTLPVDAALCDFISISAHKISGPKGIGAPWIRPGVAVAPFLHGGLPAGTSRLSGPPSPT